MATTKKDTGTSAQINEAAREIWLAGLGAFARTQKESAKLFDALVKEGESFEKRTRKDVDERVSDIRGTVDSNITKVRKMATANVSKLEDLFEDRVARVLARFGVPTAEDIKQLSKRVQELSREVKALNAPAKKAA